MPSIQRKVSINGCALCSSLVAVILLPLDCDESSEHLLQRFCLGCFLAQGIGRFFDFMFIDDIISVLCELFFLLFSQKNFRNPGSAIL